jgi:hypothetical protein
MASNHSHGSRPDAAGGAGGRAGGGSGEGSGRSRAPEWADGLKQLYDSVVEEALPDSFKDLLDRLDAIPPARGKGAARDSRDTGR